MTDAPQLLNVIYILLLIAITATLVIFLKTNLLTAYFRKRQLNSATGYLLKSPDYRVINNIRLTTVFGQLQCDYIIVSRFGVFIVETFNYDGVVEGAEWQAIWTVIKNKQKSQQFDNPIQQVESSKKVLVKLLGMNKYEIFSVVVITGAANFKSKLVENMTYGKGYLKFIQGKTRPIISLPKTQQIIDIIESEQLKSSRNKSAAVKDASSSKKQSETNLCPSCGGDMIIELVESGSDVGQQILRCTLYPTCRGSKTLV